MTYIQDEITKAKELNDRDNCEILFIEDYELDYEKFYAQTRLYSMWFKKWLCTDTLVGGTIMFFDDKPFGLTWQECRKCTNHILIFDKEVAAEVRKFMFTMMLPDSDNYHYNFVDPDISEEDLSEIVQGKERYWHGK